MDKQITSIRLNPKKRVAEYSFPLDEPVPWSSHGYYLQERPSFTADPLIHAGAYYVQEASSMLLHHVMNRLPSGPNPEKILDLCAAPGGKSTILATTARENDIVISNEVIQSRYQVLRENMIKWGYPNVITTQHDPRDFTILEEHFDLILVDAPCSGEGLWRKDPKAKEHWSNEHVNHCSLRQQRILTDILPTLKPGGFLVYSTCTFNDLENIDNVDWLAKKYGLKTINIDLHDSWKLERKERNASVGYQVNPMQTKGEGFFFSVLQKPEGETTPGDINKKVADTWLPSKRGSDLSEYLDLDELQLISRAKSDRLFAGGSNLVDEINFLSKHLSKCAPILEVGEFKRDILIPSHALALSTCLQPSTQAIHLDLEIAKAYLRRESNLNLPIQEKGWYVAKYNELALGWIKIAGGKIKNHYPMNWRVRKVF